MGTMGKKQKCISILARRAANASFPPSGAVRLGGEVRVSLVQLSYGSGFHRQLYPYGRAGFKLDGNSGSYVSIVTS